ncbi:Uncharacterized protein Adt_44079 [Abeliophyllum distichum]|uniref:Uncharacterized protein n=1 Tax=Abeliophyllum distichum TaxID=126358 RepID=A0ABD1PC48_9LAMI
MFERCRRGRYERLARSDEKAARPKLFWMKKINGRLRGVRLSRSRKLSWKPFFVALRLSKRIARMYDDFVKRMKMDEAYRATTFSCQWGLPVFFHLSVNGRN